MNKSYTIQKLRILFSVHVIATVASVVTSSLASAQNACLPITSRFPGSGTAPTGWPLPARAAFEPCCSSYQQCLSESGCSLARDLLTPRSAACAVCFERFMTCTSAASGTQPTNSTCGCQGRSCGERDPCTNTECSQAASCVVRVERPFMESRQPNNSYAGDAEWQYPPSEQRRFGYYFRPRDWDSAITALGAGLRGTSKVELFVLLQADMSNASRWVRLKELTIGATNPGNVNFAGYMYQQIDPIVVRPDSLYAVVVDCTSSDVCFFENPPRPLLPTKNIEILPADRPSLRIDGAFAQSSTQYVGYADIEITARGSLAHSHSVCQVGDALPTGRDSCVDAVCAAQPGCCSGSWGLGCIDQVAKSCGELCVRNNQVAALQKRTIAYAGATWPTPPCVGAPQGTMTSGTQLQTGKCDATGGQVFQFVEKSGGEWEIRRNATNLCLDVRLGQKVEGTPVQQYTCNDSAAQRFVLEPKPQGMQIRMAKSSLCVDIPNSTSTPGALMRLWGCNQSDAQIFSLRSPQIRKVLERTAELCIDSPGGRTTNGERLQIWICYRNDAQAWQVTDRGNNQWEVRRGTTGLCMDVPNGDAQSGRAVQQWSCNQSAAQTWVREPRAGGYQLRYAGSDLCVDIINNSNQKGAQLQLHPCNLTGAQIWGYEDPSPKNRYAIKALVNNRWVQVQNGGSGPLIAAATAIGPWELFERFDNADGSISLLSLQNNRFVTAENAGSSSLIARAQVIGSWEKFDGYFYVPPHYMRSKANNKYVTAEAAGNEPLIARATAIGPWENFQFVPQPD